MVSVWPEPQNAKSAAPRVGVQLALLADCSASFSIRRICPAAGDLNSTPARGGLRQFARESGLAEVLNETFSKASPLL